ncbi:C-type lectin domain family 12 member B-like isoform X2 [Dunckerocampus dactyliophorus]|nr:C-type lectin domain family 12 member B-like isoform X2 [Dunckerocampus dactyliophorus]XP_054637796.1 C-type lectin domain family 12 member B-like isoform X2 [Dunckerocampus dactyliophorus]
MAETDVNYASVVFRNDKHPPSRAQKAEETLYDEVKVENGHQGDGMASQTSSYDAFTKGKQSTSDQGGEDSLKAADDSVGLVPQVKEAQSHRHCQLLVCCTVLLCVTLMLAIMAFYFYQSNVAYMLAEKQNYTSEVYNLLLEIEQLNMKAKQLETDKNTLIQEVNTMKAEWNKFNISRAQWAIDTFCPEENGERRCRACEHGWVYFQSSCYLINNAERANRRTWEDARQSCYDESSDLAVVENQAHMKFISDNSWSSGGTLGYWVGLRVEDGQWKWANGSEATKEWKPKDEDSRNACAISVRSEGLKAVRCSTTQRWICKKTALSL